MREDLREHAALSPVLQDVEGLVLLASRGALFDPELLKLLTLGRVTELGAQDLTFYLHHKGAINEAPREVEFAERY